MHVAANIHIHTFALYRIRTLAAPFTRRFQYFAHRHYSSCQRTNCSTIPLKKLPQSLRKHAYQLLLTWHDATTTRTTTTEWHSSSRALASPWDSSSYSQATRNPVGHGPPCRRAIQTRVKTSTYLGDCQTRSIYTNKQAASTGKSSSLVTRTEMSRLISGRPHRSNGSTLDGTPIRVAGLRDPLLPIVSKGTLYRMICCSLLSWQPTTAKSTS